jgi:TubC N-terminal docking domain
MTLLDCLSAIRQGGGKVWTDSGTIRFKAPVGIITAEHKAVLVANKAVLVDLLPPAAPNETDTVKVAVGEQRWFESLPAAEQDWRLRMASGEWWEIVAGHSQACKQSEQKPATPLTPIRMKPETRWHDQDGFYDIPAGAPGWLVGDMDEIPDAGDRMSITDNLRQKAKAGVPSLAIWLGGIPRVVPQSMVAIGDAL